MDISQEKILVLGAQGMLGRALFKELIKNPKRRVEGKGIAEIDICNEKQLSSLISEIKPSAIINCAGFTDVEGCEDEKNQSTALAVNAEAPGKIAGLCRKQNIRFIHISTDYVFSGSYTSPIKEETPVEPCNFYGKTKALGEEAVQKAGGNYLIVRTAWLYGPTGKNFVKTIMEKAQQNPELTIVNDQIGAPTYVSDLAFFLEKLLFVTSEKIIHVTNQGSCSWFTFAQKIIEYTGIKCRVIPVTTAEFKTKARRPAYSVLSLEKLKKLTSEPIRTWDEALKKFIYETPYAKE